MVLHIAVRRVNLKVLAKMVFECSIRPATRAHSNWSAESRAISLNCKEAMALEKETVHGNEELSNQQ